MDWNPHAPTVIGLEFPPKSGPVLPAYRIDAQIKAAVMRLDSTVTETVSTLGIFVNADTAAGRIMAEILTAGSEVPAAVTTTRFYPNAQAGGSGNWNITGGLATVWQTVAQNPISTSVYVSPPASGTSILGGNNGGLEFGTASGVLTGRRIVGVRVGIVGALDPGGGVSHGTNLTVAEIASAVVTNWVVVPSSPTVIPTFAPTLTEWITDLGEMHPVTAQPWTVTDMEGFDSSARRLIIQITEPGGGVSPRVYQVYLEVDHVAENRLARRVFTAGSTGARWLTATPLKVDDTSNWAKVSGTDATLVLRQPRYGDLKPTAVPSDYLFSVPYMDGLTDTPPPGLIQYQRAALNADGTISELGTPAETRMIGWEMQVSGTQSVDAQPFVNVTEVTVSGTVQQEVSAATAQAYAGVTIPVKYATLPSGNLVVALKRRSDNAVMGTATITPAQADAFPADSVNGWRLIVAPFASNATLAAATQYYFDVTATGTWIVPSVNGTPALGSAVTGVASYVGTTNVATYSGGDVNNADLPVLAMAVVTPPTSFAAAAASVATPNAAAAGSNCRVTGIGYAHLTWVASAATSFDYYEIQRSDPFTDWATIAKVTTQATVAYDDYHARLGILSSYRIRTVNVLGGVSAWTTTATATVLAHGCGYTFTNSAYPEGSVGYGDVYDGPGFIERAFSFPETDEVERRIVHGRDGYIAFMPAERRGAEFSRRLLLSSIVTPTIPAPGGADALRDLSRAALPYVCVRDEDGGRWFANVRVSGYIDKRPGRFEYVTVEVTEVTTVEEPVTAI